MPQSEAERLKAPLHPKHWPTWCVFGLWWLLVVLLPLPIQMWLGGILGRVAARISERRARITRKNLALCFPEKTEQEREALFWESMESAGKGFFESGMAWFGPQWRLRRWYKIEGLEHLQAAHDEGKGVLLLGIHFTTIEICAAFINQSYSIDGFYRPHKNPVYEYVQRWGRVRHNRHSSTIPRSDVRGIIRNLRNKRAINYAPDQDYGKKHSVFAPFFGIPAATVTAPSQLIRVGKAKAIPYVTGRYPDDSGYYIRFYPPMDELGQGDEQADAELINQFVEREVRRNPGQYLWSHRRFKTRPDGEKDFYRVEHMPWKQRRLKQEQKRKHK